MFRLVLITLMAASFSSAVATIAGKSNFKSVGWIILHVYLIVAIYGLILYVCAENSGWKLISY
jgi:hypothetical protein